MGTWGTGAFENDDALDFAAELGDSGDRRFLEQAMTAAADCQGYLEAPESQRAVAAAEIVAALRGRPSTSLPEGVSAWARAQDQRYPELAPLAVRALDRVGANSELKELWEEGDPDEWRSALAELRQRLV